MPMDLEAEYNNRARVPGHPAILARWQKAAADYRGTASARLDQPYGDDARQRYDLFLPAGLEPRQSPVALFLHGGYWQGLDRSFFSWIAGAFAPHDVTIAIPSYRLAPAVRIADIIEDVRRAAVTIWQETGQRPALFGHSAGGHLAAVLLATDWRRYGAPDDLVTRAYAISGVFDIEPLLPTSINLPLHETAASARTVSPRHWPAPAGDRWLVAAVGGGESSEFVRQSTDMAAAWGDQGVKTEAVIIPNANHFTVLDDLARPASAMVARVSGFAHETFG